MSKKIYADGKLIYEEEDVNLDDIKIKRVPKVYHLIDICKEICDGNPGTVKSFIELLQDLDAEIPGERFLYEVGEEKIIYSDIFVNKFLKEQYIKSPM